MCLTIGSKRREKKHLKDFITWGNQNCQNINYHFARQTSKRERGGNYCKQCLVSIHFMRDQWSIQLNAQRRRWRRRFFFFFFFIWTFVEHWYSNETAFVFHLVFNERFARLREIPANRNEMSKWTNELQFSFSFSFL